jgi:large subunit ribosomal protein L21
VLLLGEGTDIKVGTPLLAGTTVSATVVTQGKTRKVSVVKFRRRQNYLRQGSHRQFFTEVEITDISGSGKVTKAKPAADKPATAEPAAEKTVVKKKASSSKKTSTKKTATKKTAKKKVTKKKTS